MKTLQVTMPREMVQFLDEGARAEKMTRSAFIRHLIQLDRKRRRREALEQQEIEAYKRMPVQPGEFAVVTTASCQDDDWEVWEKLWKESNAGKSGGANSKAPIKRARQSSSRATRQSRSSTK